MNGLVIDQPAASAVALDKVRALQTAMLAMPQLQIESTFVQGGSIGAKTVFFPAGTAVVGAMHRFENMNIIVKGDITVTTDGVPKRFTVTDAPIFVVSPPGTKRAAFVHEDTYWITLHATDEKNVDEVEAEFVVPEHEETEFLKMIGE